MDQCAISNSIVIVIVINILVKIYNCVIRYIYAVLYKRTISKISTNGNTINFDLAT